MNSKKSAAALLQRIFLLGFVLIGTASISYGQVGKLLKSEINENEPKFLLRLDGKNSFIANTQVKIQGIQVGANFGKRLQLGVGYHTNRLGKSAPLAANSINEEVYLDYGSVFLEYLFFNKGRFTASYPLQMGIGDISSKITGESTGEHNFLMIYEAVMVVNYHPTKIFSIGTGLGYRVLLFGNRSFGLNFNSPIYSLKFNLNFEEILSKLNQTDLGGF
ncbi:hypothetical protein [Luteibaculum oceani]|uniref:Outer membrane protein beta-barrel domain-containing protein n=1 Tax=Luteibaculum oceani TaxID=1294296 RepID=A0A5C6VJP3_9FLAO|nr:hypothetical protein [Luteibaculum oceani]TXC85069.1 hypothetical protein FRX97_00150 [Luteibaculum oceani]